MENKEAMWKVVGVVAALCIVASFGFIYSVIRDIVELTPRDSSMLEEVWKALRKTDSSYASDK